MFGASDYEGYGSLTLGGPVQLNWRPETSAPVASGNDAFAAPTTLIGTNGSVTGDTAGATAEVGEPAHAGAPARSSVWYSWTPPKTGDYVLNSSAEDNDGCAARLAVYTGNALTSLTAVPAINDFSAMSARKAAGVDDGPDVGSAPDQLRVHLTAGTTYRVAADRLGRPGSFTLRWDIPQAAPVIRSATPGDGSLGVIWAPPPATAGSPRTGYFVAAIAVGADSGAYDTGTPQTLPITSAFTTLRGLHNGTSYRIVVAAINSSGLGDFAVSRPVTPKKLK